MAEPTPTPERTVSPWVKIFVAAHIFCITVWAIPQPPESIRTGKSPPQGTDWILVWNSQYLKNLGLVRDYCTFTGFWQYWDMFSPNPAQIDYWGDADVIYRDGSVRHYKYPRMFDLSIPAKYPMERYRKYFERAHSEDYRFLWPVFAQRIALECDDNPQNPPVLVKLRRHWLQIVTPGRIQPTAYNEYEYYQHHVDQRALAEARTQ